MSKRRLSDQQKARIETLQSERTGDPGLVIARWGRSCIVEAADGAQHQAKFRTNLPPIVVGDHVNWQIERDDVVITHLLERKNLIIRPSPHGEAKAVAANVDQLLLVICPQPAPTALLIDRYLTHASFLRLPLRILVNKSDLDLAPLKDIIPIYEALNYPISFVSTKTEAGIHTLEAILADKTSIMLGQSGVGKSSLMQALLPGQEIRIGALSERQVGQHTTTTSMLYHVGSGHLIDTPGIYDFATWHLGAQAIAQGFTEIHQLSEHCQFRNCSHSHEPTCAVKSALEQGRISRSRYQNFLTMCQEKH